ncbi:hypothetical protein HID58_029960 [Brassica napus]|uniref:Uncharacterized protein n=1 Tax=Brassica napus TaxID=3708 RepID=A0ABQ8CEK9_BRANA|nr:hypothetical protein HID58_029960 [Brassica napus]
MASPPRALSVSFFVLPLLALLINPATSIRTSIIKLPRSDGSRSAAADTYCESWRLAVETNNAGTWDVLPSSCVDSVARYLNGDHVSRSEPFDSKSFNEWVVQGTLREMNETWFHYCSANWLILRGPDDQGKSATNYKSEQRSKLIDQGFKIHGNTGDQWSDLLGFAVADRSFKVPNPMYYIP